MNRTKILIVSLTIICLTIVSVVEISAQPPAKKDSGISVHKIEEEVVLYTIYRGSYDKIGPAIGGLYALAGKKGISPRGPVYYVYLNNPNRVSNEHWLTEVRIPVSKDALKAAGTLGEMTDIKTLPPTEAAVAVKPEGQADPTNTYDKLYAWIFKEGYMTVDSAREVFLTNAMSGDYSQMKSEIIIPIRKVSRRED